MNSIKLPAAAIKIQVIIALMILLISSGGYSQEFTPGSPGFKSLFNSNDSNGIACYRIPAIAVTPNGDIIAVADERVPSCGDLKWNRDINIVIRRSSDNGETWSAIERVVDYPDGKSASDPSLIVDRVTGEIFLFFNYMDHELEKDVYYLMVTGSTDNGVSWSTPLDITSHVTGPGWHYDFKFITSGRGIQTRSGKLLHCMVNLEKGLYLFESDDHGITWALIDTPISPANESKVVELEDGRWMVNSRVEGSGMRFVHISADRGKSWISNPDPGLADPGCNASIIRYSSAADGSGKNRLLFSNANTRDRRENMTVRISYDEGKTWPEGKTVYPGSSAYSSLCVLENGDIGLIFEKDNYSDIVFTRLTLDWLTDGKDYFCPDPGK